MGQFSWLDCNDNSQILNDVNEDVFVLVPKEFGGEKIAETYYDGYGHFGSRDIYSLVAEWNREYLSTHPEFEIPYHGKVKNMFWYPYYSDLSLSPDEVVQRVRSNVRFSDTMSRYNFDFKYRYIGIDIACYDKQNAALPYPIKITHNWFCSYEQCPYSKTDPLQGWEMNPELDEDFNEDDYDMEL